MTDFQNPNYLDLPSLQRVLAKFAFPAREEQQIFSKKEAAEFFKMKVSTLERYAFKKHEIAYGTSGKNAVFLRRDLLKFLEKRRIPSVYEEGV